MSGSSRGYQMTEEADTAAARPTSERQVVTSQREGQRAKPTQPIEVAHGLKRKLLQAQQDGAVADVDDIGRQAEADAGGKVEAKVPSEAQQDNCSVRKEALADPAGPSEASLREYFLNDYKSGGAFEHDAYEHDAADWCWIHKRSGIKVWQDALDLTQSGGSGEVDCLFHYTTQLGFKNITTPSKKAVEVFASLITEGPKANAWWGRGVYSVRKAPHEWADVATLMDNNYRNMCQRDAQSQGHETAIQEYRSRVAYCIPIIVNATMTYDVSIQQTPEMQKEGKPPGVNLAGNLLNEPGQLQRQCIVIRVERGEDVGHASAVLVDTLQCRADATAERFGPEHEETLLALSRLAKVLEERGAFGEAEPLLRRVLRVTHREHRRTLTLHNLALVLEKLGRLSEAEPLYRRAIAGKEAQVGPQHPSTLSSATNLALLLQTQGKLEEAEQLHRRAIAGFEVQLGPQHPHTLSAVNNLALLLQKQGKLEEAEPLYRRDLEGSEAQLGPDHPGTLISVNNFGVFLRDLGRLGESDILLQRAVAGREAQLGTSHPDTLCSVLALAKLRAAQSRLDEAELLFRRALEGLEAPLGVQHPWTLGAMAGLAKLLEAKGSFQEAEDLYLRELRSLQEVHGSDHEKTAESLRNWQCFQQEHGGSGTRTGSRP